MGDDEAHGLAPLFVHELGFAHAEIAQGLAVFRYGAGKTRMLVVVVFVVADVELEREIRTQRNKPIEHHEVAQGPRNAAQGCEAERKRRSLEPRIYPR